MIEQKILKFIRKVPMPRSVRLHWTKILIDREYRREIEEITKTKDWNTVKKKEHEHHFELKLISDHQDSLHTDRLLRRARRLRVSVPRMPKYTDNGYEQSEDWEQGLEGDMLLTNTGIGKIREEIRREEKWRREGRANWAVLLSALGGVIGTLIGLVSVFLK